MSLPLSRFKVLDLTRVRSGPTAVRQFADWGADVIMVEPKAGEGEIVGDRDGSDFQNLNRNKRSIALDLKSAEGREVFLRLARDADVLFENFRPEVKNRLGIDYETLNAINPRLVYVSISGFGQEGPYASRPGLDQVIQGLGGLMSVTGLPGQGPVRTGIAVADTSAGLFAAMGAMTALLEREVTGRGSWVRTSLLQAQIAVLDFQAARWLIDGKVPEQAGNDHPTAVPMGLFETSDGVVNIAAAGEAMFRTFCIAIGEPDLAEDPRFKGMARRDNREALNAKIAGILITRPAAYWIESLNAAGVPCGPVNRMDEVFADPQVASLNIAQPLARADGSVMNLVGQPIEISGADPKPRTVAPAKGEHTDQILGAAGYSPEDIADLRARGVI